MFRIQFSAWPANLDFSMPVRYACNLTSLTDPIELPLFEPGALTGPKPKGGRGE